MFGDPLPLNIRHTPETMMDVGDEITYMEP